MSENCKNGICAVDSAFAKKLKTQQQELELELALAKLDNADMSTQSAKICLSAITASLLALSLAIACKANEMPKTQSSTKSLAFIQKIKAENGFMSAIVRISFEKQAWTTLKK